MITLRGLCASVRKSLAAAYQEAMAEAVLIAEKRRQKEAVETAWASELKRREEAAADADGSREAERLAKQERQEQERLNFLAAQIIRQTMKSVSR